MGTSSRASALRQTVEHLEGVVLVTSFSTLKGCAVVVPSLPEQERLASRNVVAEAAAAGDAAVVEVGEGEGVGADGEAGC
jgi:hypothetical protein